MAYDFIRNATLKQNTCFLNVSIPCREKGPRFRVIAKCNCLSRSFTQFNSQRNLEQFINTGVRLNRPTYCDWVAKRLYKLYLVLYKIFKTPYLEQFINTGVRLNRPTYCDWVKVLRMVFALAKTSLQNLYWKDLSIESRILYSDRFRITPFGRNDLYGLTTDEYIIPGMSLSWFRLQCIVTTW